MANSWKSRYGKCFVSFPSVIKQSNLDYEVLEIKKERTKDGK